MKPIKTPPKQLNIEDTESLKCDACGNYTFIKSYFIRRVSPLMSPNGQEAMKYLLVVIVVKYQIR